MQRRLDPLTTAVAVLAIVATLLACKKRTTATSPAAETAAALPPAPPAAPSTPTAAVTGTAGTAEPAAKLGEVKRYPDKEQPQAGAVRILEDDVKVFNEADDKTAEVATLPKNLLVFRIASVPEYELVEFPSGVGKVSPGWVLSKLVDVKNDTKVERGAVAKQSAQAVVKPAAKASSSAVASAKAATSSSAKAAADKAAADKAAADKAAADKAALEKAAAQAGKFGDRLKKAAEAAVGGKASK